MQKLKAIFVFTLVSLMLSSSFASSNAFATHLSEEIKWQLIFISDRSCSLNHFFKMNVYNEITEKYLELYSLENSHYEPSCISHDEFLTNYEKPNDLDLIILVYDRELGEKLLHTQKMGGLYSHTGRDITYNHVIIFCDCSSFYYSDPPWILTHELSHFILYFRNHEMSVIEDLIHTNDELYDKCREGGSNCDSYIEKIRIQSSPNLISVMPILELKKSDKGIETNNTETQVTLIGLTKMITKWWADGKITDGDYANAIGHLAENDFEQDINSEILITDEPLKPEETWKDKFSEINLSYRGQNYDNTNQNDKPLEQTNNLVDEKFGLSVEEVLLGLPDWFKTTAGWWAKNKISDDEFKRNIHFLVKSGIIRPHSTEIFKGVINDQETLLESSLSKISEEVKSLIDSDGLKNEDGETLIKKLDKASNNFNFDETKQGCNTLENFIEKVSDLIDTDKITEIEGQSLINGADLVKFNFCY